MALPPLHGKWPATCALNQDTCLMLLLDNHKQSRACQLALVLLVSWPWSLLSLP